MRRITFSKVAVALAVLVVAAGCSDSDSTPGAASLASEVPRPAAEFAAATAKVGEPAHGRFDAAASLVGGDPLVVITADGAVRGALNSGVRQFQTIPYAAAPVGDLRFRAPQPVAPWSTPRDATAKAPTCMQMLPVVNLTTGQEDCLYLNVVTPEKPGNHLVPVMVWIHGGGFTVGSVNDDSPVHLVERSGVVVVSINYRLGPFGFLAHDALAKEDPGHAVGNMGFLDQVAALEWVQRSVAAFGGDPHHVTLFGESAGAMSICSHLYSARSVGLFQRTILQSGPCDRAGIPLAPALVQGRQLATTVHCDTAPDVLACLRHLGADAVFSAMPGDPTFLFRKAAFWMPAADEVTLPSDLSAVRAAGRFSHVPILAGVTRDEGRLFFGMAAHAIGSQIPPVTASDYTERLGAYFGAKLGPEVAKCYPLAMFPDPGAAFGQTVGDAILACPAVDGALAFAPVVPVHLYQYEHTPNQFVLPVTGIDMGAFHSSELAYVFGLGVATTGNIEFSAAERALSDSMIDAWTRFAATGDPSGPGFDWPIAGSELSYRVLDTSGRVRKGLRTALCDFWAHSGFDAATAGRQQARSGDSRSSGNLQPTTRLPSRGDRTVLTSPPDPSILKDASMIPRSPMIRAVAPVVIFLTALSGCGSSAASSKLPSLNGASASAATPSSTTIDPEKAAQEFVTCLRGQGINAADPKVGADGQIDFRSIIQGANINPGDANFRTIMQKCGDKLQGAGFGAPSGARQKEREQASLALTTCLRGQGLTVQDLPTGGPGFGGRGDRGPGGANGTPPADGSTTTTAASSSSPANGSGDGGGFGGGQRPPQTAEERTARLAERLGVDPTDPKVVAAFKSCDKEMTAMTTFGRGGSTTTTTAG